GEQLGVDRPPSSRTTTALSVVVAGLLILGIVGVVTHDPTPATIHVSVGAAGDRLREATSYRLRTSIKVRGEAPAIIQAQAKNMSMSTVVDVRNRRVPIELDVDTGHRS